jgi:hypothetical protein
MRSPCSLLALVVVGFVPEEVEVKDAPIIESDFKPGGTEHAPLQRERGGDVGNAVMVEVEGRPAEGAVQ